jgi:hypothetical protein
MAKRSELQADVMPETKNLRELDLEQVRIRTKELEDYNVGHFAA